MLHIITSFQYLNRNRIDAEVPHIYVYTCTMSIFLVLFFVLRPTTQQGTRRPPRVRSEVSAWALTVSVVSRPLQQLLSCWPPALSATEVRPCSVHDKTRRNRRSFSCPSTWLLLDGGPCVWGCPQYAVFWGTPGVTPCRTFSSMRAVQELSRLP